MKNNKGFAISSVIYAMLILFLGLILLILGNLASRKAMFDKEKNEILSKFNGYDQSVCTPSAALSNSSAVLVTGDSNKFAIGAEYKCELGDGVSRIFYVLEETSTKVSLIMSENLGSDVAWVSKDDYIASGGTESEYGSLGKVNKGPITLKKTLAERTEGWNKINQAQIKLPTGDQIAKASGLTAWRLSDGYESLLSKNWLFGNLYSTSNTSLSHGYWTSAAYTSTNYSWLVSYTGALTMRYPSADSIVGIRPVIELSKSSFDEPVLCTAKTTATTGRVPEGTYEYGDEYTCDLGESADAKNLTFFVIAKTDTEVSLIMDRNIGATAMWSGDGSNHKSDSESSQAITAKSALSSATSNWSKITKARISLPTEAQISAIYTNTMPTWLYGNLSNSGIMGYWTSSPYSGDTIDAWYVDASGYLIYTSVSNSYGIRPVITISKSQTKTPKIKTYKDGEVVYFDVDNGTKCTSSEAVSTTGTKSGCMKFYAFNDDGGDTVNLILDHNTTATVEWVSKADYVAAGGTESDYGSYGKNDKGPLTVLKQLKSDTESWKGTETPSNYTMDQTGQGSNAKYTIDYSGYKARLITAQEIATITDYSGWDEKVAGGSDWYLLDSKTTTQSDTCKEGNTSGCQYGWLYDRTNKDCTKYGCLNNSDKTTYGYWTASSRAARSNYAWGVGSSGRVDYDSVSYSSGFGVRPVIEVSRSKLNTETQTVVYRWTLDKISIGDIIDDPSNTAKFTKDVSTLGKSYYLKHVLDKNNKVIESYACAIYNGKEYCIKGGNSSFYIENKKVLEGLESLGLNCILEDNYSYCKDDSTRLYATSSGDVFADDNNGSCDVEDNKNSYCENS